MKLILGRRFVLLLVAFACSGVNTKAQAPGAGQEAFVEVSARNPRYFALSDGRPYIPIGLNLIHPRRSTPDEGLADMEEWLVRLSANGGNFARIWLSSPFWEVEHQRAGEFDAAKAERIDRLIGIARQLGIRLKFTVEHFREIDPEDVRQRWALKALHHESHGGTARTMPEWFENPQSRLQFREKLNWFAKRYPSEPTIFGWELWNEINAVRGDGYKPWTEEMLGALRQMFPRNLAMQSLGSFDTASNRETYRWLCAIENNDVAQVHRYLDLGARLEICHGPVDILAADAVRELLAMNPRKPVLLAESGAVERGHTGPFKLYAKDTDGSILHDVLFAPFFAGAAGAGQSWHWIEYVDRNQLWRQFRGFAEAVHGIDPAAEQFSPRMLSHPTLRIYALAGRKTSLLWCRDPRNDWRSELAEGRAPEKLAGVPVNLAELTMAPDSRVTAYDPWRLKHCDLGTGSEVVLPEFKRSIVLRIEAPNRNE